MKGRRKPLDSILVKPSGPDCNMGCEYCFYLEKDLLYPESQTHRMSIEVLEEMIKQVMQQSGESVSIGWQGGEPTLLGLDFFKKAVQFEKIYGQGKTVGNGFQTNGILINKEWAKLLNEYSFLIGFSLDGPEHIHNKYRWSKDKKGTWQKVENSAKLLLDEGVAVNTLTCITDYSVRFPEEIYNYHKSLGFEFMQFIPIVETDKTDPSQAAPFSVTPDKFGEFLCKIWDLWIADFKNGIPTTSVRHFDSVFHTYVGLQAPECTLHKECGVYVVIEHNGDVYSCDFFVEPKWKLGNIMKDKIINLLNSKKQDQFGKIKAHVPPPCRRCNWYRHCFGGCTKDRVRDPRDKGLSHFCQSYQMFFAHADTELRRLAEDWKKKQLEQYKKETKGIYDATKDFI